MRTPNTLLVALVALASACSTTADTPSTQGVSTTSTIAVPTTETSPETPSAMPSGTVSVFGAAVGAEAAAIQAALDAFTVGTGIEATYTGASDFDRQVLIQTEAGNAPDIGLFSRPGVLRRVADLGELEPLPDEVIDVVGEEWPESWRSLGVLDDVTYAVPVEAELASLVWYSPGRFEEAGYLVPRTWSEFSDLVDQMIADGRTPLCLGIESGVNTGWPFTDWVEDLTLRFGSAEFYDRWVAHEVPFDNPFHEDIWQQVLEIWTRPGAAFSPGGTIASTYFGDLGPPLADGQCEMHRQGSFFSHLLPTGTTLGPDGDIDAFYFPGPDADTRPVLGGATLAGAFRDAPEVWRVVEFLGSAGYAEARAATGSGFLSAAVNQDLTFYDDFDRTLVGILLSADVVRFDASDLLPPEIGVGAYVTAAVDVVIGLKSVPEALTWVEERWPEDS